MSEDESNSEEQVQSEDDLQINKMAEEILQRQLEREKIMNEQSYEVGVVSKPKRTIKKMIQPIQEESQQQESNNESMDEEQYVLMAGALIDQYREQPTSYKLRKLTKLLCEMVKLKYMTTEKKKQILEMIKKLI